jgi:hypothetical protein
MPGRFGAESVADFKRNQWPIWRGIGGRFGPESPFFMVTLSFAGFPSDPQDWLVILSRFSVY